MLAERGSPTLPLNPRYDSCVSFDQSGSHDYPRRPVLACRHWNRGVGNIPDREWHHDILHAFHDALVGSANLCVGEIFGDSMVLMRTLVAILTLIVAMGAEVYGLILIRENQPMYLMMFGWCIPSYLAIKHLSR